MVGFVVYKLDLCERYVWGTWPAVQYQVPGIDTRYRKFTVPLVLVLVPIKY